MLRSAYQRAAIDLIYNHQTGKITHKLDQLANVFLKLGKIGTGSVDEKAIHSILADDKTKAKSLHAQLLFRAFGFRWDELKYQNAKEIDRINAIIERSSEKPFGEIIRKFSDHLFGEQRYKPKTVRVYLACSQSFLESVYPSGEISDNHDKVARFLRDHPGLRSSLRVFFNFLKETYQIILEKSDSRRSSDRQLDKALRGNVALLGRRIRSSENKSELKSLTAKYISLLYGIPLASVLMARVSEFYVVSGSLAWIYEDDVIHIEPIVSNKIITHFFPEATSYLFFGQTKEKPLTESSVFYWTQTVC